MTKKLSRSLRMAAIVESISIAVTETKELEGELESWLENMPKNLQDGTKAGELQEAIDWLEEVIDHLNEAIDSADDVNFPGMF